MSHANTISLRTTVPSSWSYDLLAGLQSSLQTPQPLQPKHRKLQTSVFHAKNTARSTPRHPLPRALLGWALNFLGRSPDRSANLPGAAQTSGTPTVSPVRRTSSLASAPLHVLLDGLNEFLEAMPGVKGWGAPTWEVEVEGGRTSVLRHGTPAATIRIPAGLWALAFASLSSAKYHGAMGLAAPLVTWIEVVIGQQ